jgi:mono/diheme cytochrome c family protein
MRARENYTPYITVAFGLTLAILVSFQAYLIREPGRIQGDEARDKAAAIAAGSSLFDKNCAPCHGSQGEGDIGPALNDKQFLNTAADDTIFSVISSGVPGSQMPAWNQSHGGPMTNENVQDLVAFIRNWEASAPDRRATPVAGDPDRGARIFANVCIVCHGDNGKGTARAPALNDPARLSQLDDAWYRSTITNGRLAQGMPTWGTVLSPGQVNDLIALLDTWRQGGAAQAPAAAADVARPSNAGGPGQAAHLTGDPAAGTQIFVDNCQKCHGPTGQGGVANPGSSDGTIPALSPIDPTLVDGDAQVYAYNLDLFLEHGSTPAGPNPKQKMPAWGDDKKLAPQQIADVIAYVMSLNPAPARPSNPGGAGPAAALAGSAAAGAQVFTTNCEKCHGPNGQGGVPNPGSTDGTIPPLNPIDPTLTNKDAQVYGYNLDLFLEHGSTPAGPSPKEKMPAWGDEKKLTPQQIADAIAYLISLNPPK